MGIWWDTWGTAAEIQWDKDHGINFYTRATPAGCLPASSRWAACTGSDEREHRQPRPLPEALWPGTFLEDEVDGQNSEAAGKAKLAALRDQVRAAAPGKPIFNNFTGMVVEKWYADSFGNGYVNDYQDATSADIYFATDTDYRCTGGSTWWPFIMAAPADVSHCRDPQSYGKAIDGLRIRDAADGKLQPLAAFVENGRPATRRRSSRRRR